MALSKEGKARFDARQNIVDAFAESTEIVILHKGFSLDGYAFFRIYAIRTGMLWDMTRDVTTMLALTFDYPNQAVRFFGAAKQLLSVVFSDHLEIKDWEKQRPWLLI